MNAPTFDQRIAGALFGGAIGDGMGGPVEGWSAAQIAAKFGDWNFRRFIPTQEWKPKGEGRITDDTLMVEALIRAYGHKRDHMDAYDFRDFLLPEVTETVVWLPERQADMPIIDRMNAIEKYTWFRLALFGAEPRTAGVGNAINCAIAMFIWPVGAVNAGDPVAAYQEAAALGIAESSSFAVEGAAVLAAAYAEAFRVGATVDSILAVSLRLARDGTLAAIDAVLKATDPADTLDDFIAKTRAAFLPFDHKERHVPVEFGGKMEDGNHPSPRLTIEEVPIALAAMKWSQGNFLLALRAGVAYGRDCDTIAAMVAGLVGALQGVETVPPELCTDSNSANRRDWGEMASAFTQTILEIHGKDRSRFDARSNSMAAC